MSTEVKQAAALKGGEWLIKESSPFETFIPEDFSEEQLMIRDMCEQFLDKEVYPILDRIDAMEPGLMKGLVTKAGEQGLLSVSFPEEYGGLGKDFVTSTIVNEYLGAGHSPEISFGIYFCFCSGVPKYRIGKVPIPVCAAIATEKEWPAPRYSFTIVEVTKSFPRPPYSSGKETESNP